jgi:hypothetical protein
MGALEKLFRPVKSEVSPVWRVAANMKWRCNFILNTAKSAFDH